MESIGLANDVRIFLMTIGKALSRSDVSDNTAATEGNFAEIRSREIAKGKAADE